MKIDKDIPVPKTRHRPRAPWDQMTAGSSVFFPLPPLPKIASGVERALAKVELRRKHRAALQAKANRYFGPKNYTTRLVEEGGVEGFRVWRKS